MNDFPRVIIVSGTPGVGKTTIAKILAQILDYSIIHLNDFILEKGLYYGYDHTRDSVIIDDEMVTSKIIEEVNSLSNLLIIEGHTAEIVPKEFTKIVIILRCKPNILRQRLQQSRRYSPSKIEENIQAEIMDECLISAQYYFPKEMIVEIATSNLSPREIADKIYSILKIYR